MSDEMPAEIHSGRIQSQFNDHIISKLFRIHTSYAKIVEIFNQFWDEYHMPRKREIRQMRLRSNIESFFSAAYSFTELIGVLGTDENYNLLFPNSVDYYDENRDSMSPKFNTGRCFNGKDSISATIGVRTFFDHNKSATRKNMEFHTIKKSDELSETPIDYTYSIKPKYFVICTGVERFGLSDEIDMSKLTNKEEDKYHSWMDGHFHDKYVLDDGSIDILHICTSFVNECGNLIRDILECFENINHSGYEREDWSEGSRGYLKNTVENMWMWCTEDDYKFPRTNDEDEIDYWTKF